MRNNNYRSLFVLVAYQYCHKKSYPQYGHKKFISQQRLMMTCHKIVRRQHRLFLMIMRYSCVRNAYTSTKKLAVLLLIMLCLFHFNCNKNWQLFHFRQWTICIVQFLLCYHFKAYHTTIFFVWKYIEIVWQNICYFAISIFRCQ